MSTEVAAGRAGRGRKLNIACLIDAQGGGALTHILTLAREIDKDEAEFKVLFFIAGPGQHVAEELGVPYVLINKRMSLDPTLVLRLYRYLKRNRVDILHTHTINSNFYGRLAAALAGVPVVTTMHSYMIDELAGLEKSPLASRLFFHIDRAMSGFTKRFIAVSGGIRKRLLEQGVQPEKIDTIPHGIFLPGPEGAGVDPLALRRELGIGAEAQVVAIVGRLVPVKNHDVFLRAAAGVLKGSADVRFLVVGDGAQREALEALAHELGISKDIVFTGWRNDMDAIYSAVDVLVLCSSTESLGLVLVEAMAHGKAVIATDVDEISKTVIDEKTGLLVRVGDPSGLADAISRLVKDRVLREKLGGQGRRLVEDNFSVHAMTEKIMRLYKSAAEG